VRRTLVVLGASITGLIVLFVIDLVTPRDVVVASLYVLPILLAAAVLSIGRRTVETHLAHAYAKLGVKSKVALIMKRERLLGAVKDKSGRGV